MCLQPRCSNSKTTCLRWCPPSAVHHPPASNAPPLAGFEKEVVPEREKRRTCAKDKFRKNHFSPKFMYCLLVWKSSQVLIVRLFPTPTMHLSLVHCCTPCSFSLVPLPKWGGANLAPPATSLGKGNGENCITLVWGNLGQINHSGAELCAPNPIRGMRGDATQEEHILFSVYQLEGIYPKTQKQPCNGKTSTEHHLGKHRTGTLPLGLPCLHNCNMQQPCASCRLIAGKLQWPDLSHEQGPLGRP